MKSLDQDKVAEKIFKISRNIKESGIIKTCYDLAFYQGEGSKEVHDYHTCKDFVFEEEGIKIDLSDGWTDFGGGRVKVYENGKQVLFLDRYGKFGDQDLKGIVPEVEGFHVMLYRKGSWEEKVIKMLERGKKKEEKPSQLEIKEEKFSEETIQYLKENFSEF